MHVYIYINTYMYVCLYMYVYIYIYIVPFNLADVSLRMTHFSEMVSCISPEPRNPWLSLLDADEVLASGSVVAVV